LNDFFASRLLPSIPTFDKPLDSYSHEVKLSTLVSLTLLSSLKSPDLYLLHSQNLGLWVEGIISKGQSGLTPNVIE